MMGNLRMGLGIFGGLVSSILLFKSLDLMFFCFFFRSCLIEQIRGRGVCGSNLETCTLSQAKICDFPLPIFRPDAKHKYPISHL